VSTDLKQDVSDYISSHTHCVMATSREDNPRAATVMYAPDGFNIIVHTIRGTSKVRNVEANPNVALVIDDKASEGWGQAKMLQYIGKAEIVTSPEEQQKAVAIYTKRFAITKRMLTPEGLAKDQVLIKITPVKIYFSDYSKGYGHREKLESF